MRPVGFVCCGSFLSGRGETHLRMTEQSQLAGLTTTEGNHGSMQGIQESAPQSNSNAEEVITI